MAPEPAPTVASVLIRGATGRCAWCGRGLLSLAGWFRLPRRCPQCHLPIEREEGAFLGSMVVSYTLTCLILVVVLGAWMVGTVPDIPVVPIIAVGAAIIVAVPILSYPFAKTIWVAIDLLLHRMDRHDLERLSTDLDR